MFRFLLLLLIAVPSLAVAADDLETAASQLDLVVPSFYPYSAIRQNQQAPFIRQLGGFQMWMGGSRSTATVTSTVTASSSIPTYFTFSTTTDTVVSTITLTCTVSTAACPAGRALLAPRAPEVVIQPTAVNKGIEPTPVPEDHFIKSEADESGSLHPSLIGSATPYYYLNPYLQSSFSVPHLQYASPYFPMNDILRMNPYYGAAYGGPLGRQDQGHYSVVTITRTATAFDPIITYSSSYVSCSYPSNMAQCPMLPARVR